MKRYNAILIASISMITLLSGCAAIEGIFKAGVWTGIIAVVAIIVIIIWIFSKLSGKNRQG